MNKNGSMALCSQREKKTKRLKGIFLGMTLPRLLLSVMFFLFFVFLKSIYLWLSLACDCIFYLVCVCAHLIGCAGVHVLCMNISWV